MAIQPQCVIVLNQGNGSDVSKKGIQPEPVGEWGEAVVLHFFLIRITQTVVNNSLLKQFMMAVRHSLLLRKTPVIKQLSNFTSPKGKG